MSTTTEKRIELMRMPINDLVFDPEVNRLPSDHWSKRLAGRFDPAALGVLVGWKNGREEYIVLDGQHRVLAARETGYTGDIDVKVYLGYSLAEAVDLFLKLNDTRTVHVIDKYQKSVTAGYDTEVAINDILAARDLKVGHDAEKDLGCPVQLRAVYKRHDGHGLEVILDTLTGAWPDAEPTDKINALTLKAISDLMHVYARQPTGVDISVLREQMAETSVGALTSETVSNWRQDRARSKAWHMTALLVKAYNAGVPKGKRLAEYIHVAG